MSFNIILNSSNLVGTGNNQYKYNFLNGGLTVPEGSEMSISQITIPYSWYNISAALGNNQFFYSIPSSSGFTTVTVTLTDGFYTITDLNNALSASLKANGFYFYNATNPLASGVSNIPSSQIIYPIQFGTNANNYTNTITLVYIPNSSGNVTAQLGTNWVWAGATYPTNAALPTVTIFQQSGVNISGSTYGLGNILGFTNGTYPSTSALYYGLVTTFSTNVPSITNSVPVTINGNSLANYTYTGSGGSVTIGAANPTFPPLGSKVNGVIVRCNLIENNITFPTDILDSFPLTSTFGQNISYLPIADNSVKMKTGKFSSLTIQFVDQNYNPITILDNNVLISLLIKFPDKK